MAADDSSSPLLPPQFHHDDASEEKPDVVLPANSFAAATSLDDMIERCVGSLGSAQILQAFLVSFAWVFDAQQTFVNVFTDAQPTWHCTRPYHGDGACSSAPRPCGLPSGSWAWDRPAHTSVVSEWALECAGTSVAGLPASAFFAGCLVGGLALATLADSSLGRKKMLFFSCFVMSLTGVLTAASQNVWVYSGLRFVSGIGRATIGTSALILSTETVGKRWRGEVGIIGFFCFTLGFLSLPAMAYANRESSWRTLYLWTSVPALFYSLLAHFLVRESPRWLLVRGRKEEAVETLKEIAASNGREDAALSCSFSGVSAAAEETWNVDTYSALKILLEKRWAARRLAAVMTVGFGIGMVYYGMPLGVGDLGFDNLYLSVAFNALAELPSALVTFLLVGRLNRRSSVLVFALASGVCSVACVFLRDEAVRMAVEVVSFFSGCTAFNVVLIYSLELFPTCVRNSALSMVRQALVLGGVFAPLMVAAARKERRFLSFGVFGLVIGCCGLFVVCLPETRGRGICDTLEEQEYKETASSDKDYP